MKVTPISFCGQKEIIDYANRYNPLTRDEKEVKNLALKLHEVNVAKNSTEAAIQQNSSLIKKYIRALKSLTMPSAFGYHVAVDTLNSNLLKADVASRESIKGIAVEIAKNSPEVGRYDLLKLLSHYIKK